jgi:FkbM family methyltransferase
MSKVKDNVFNLLPKGIQQKIRNKYYEVKISKATEKDEADLLVVSKILKHGQTAIDIGANYGLYTKHLSSYVGNAGTVLSFEPIAKTFSSLQHNVKALKLHNVKLYNCALSDKKGKANMYIPDYKDGGENLYEASLSSHMDSPNSESVEINVLDEIIGKNEGIDFLKIDVEGHEMNVLKGSLSTIERCVPLMLIEINGGIHTENQQALDILSLLKSWHYTPYKRSGSSLVKLTKKDDGFNYFFLTPDHEERHRAIILH